MIPFFRKIRKKLAEDNQFLKYCRYAVGEIVLVVIGILIAISINNWNQTKKQLLKTQNLSYRLAKQVSQNIEKSLNAIGNINKQVNGIVTLKLMIGNPDEQYKQKNWTD